MSDSQKLRQLRRAVFNYKRACDGMDNACDGGEYESIGKLAEKRYNDLIALITDITPDEVREERECENCTAMGLCDDWFCNACLMLFREVSL